MCLQAGCHAGHGAQVSEARRRDNSTAAGGSHLQGADCSKSLLNKLCLRAQQSLQHGQKRSLPTQEEITHCAAGVRWLSHLHSLAHSQHSPAEEASSSQSLPVDWAAEARQHGSVQAWFHVLVRRHFRGSLKVRKALVLHGQLILTFAAADTSARVRGKRCMAFTSAAQGAWLLLVLYVCTWKGSYCYLILTRMCADCAAAVQYRGARCSRVWGAVVRATGKCADRERAQGGYEE